MSLPKTAASAPLNASDGIPSDALGLQHHAWARFWRTLPGHLVVILVSYLAACFDRIPMGAAQAITLVSLVPLAAIAWMISSGRAAHMADPLLTFPQAATSILLAELGYALVPDGRGAAMLWLAVIITFDMRRLTPKQLVVLSGLAMALQMANFLWAWARGASGSVFAEELIQLGFVAILLAELTQISRHARYLVRLRTQQHNDKKTVYERLSFLAVRDALTGAYNRRHVNARLTQEAHKSHRSGRPFSVAMMDLDFFKRINDQFGHGVGDTVLKQFVALASAVVQDPVEVLGRWGGEEFIIVLPECNRGQAQARLHSLLALVRNHDWGQHQYGLSLTFSCGIAEHAAGASVDATLEAADRALYEAKSQGRNRIMPAFSMAVMSPTVDAPRPVAGMSQSSALPTPSSAHKPRRAHADGKRASRWSRWILGQDAEMRSMISVQLVGSTGYLIGLMVLLFYVMPARLLPDAVAWVLVAYLAIIIALPYPLIRSGWSRRFEDHGMLFAQNSYGFVGIVIAYAYLPQGKSALLAVLGLIQVFGFLNLTPRQARWSGLGVIAMVALAWSWRTWESSVAPDGWDPLAEAIRLAAALPMLLLLTHQAHRHSQEHEMAREDARAIDEAIEQARNLGTRDALTGLSNRQHLQELLDAEAARSALHSGSLGLAIIDLDHFKCINDTHGHHVGDEVLVAFAQLAHTNLRQTDVIGRWGGEEFVVVMPETHPDEGALVALERLLQRMRDARLSSTVPELAVTFSAGVAVHQPGDSWTATLERADQLLYEAKHQGRDRCVFEAGEAPADTSARPRMVLA
jgi:diguanylate cyclase (GGDEF)-like protein